MGNGDGEYDEFHAGDMLVDLGFSFFHMWGMVF
jgi:hypothetical protein